jgi:ketosteroid isomerase-like protein
MTSRRTALIFVTSLLPVAGCTAMTPLPSPADAREQVRRAELAFAATMAARDPKAFAGFIAEDAVFINGGQPLRGRAAIVQHWQRFFEGPTAPFSWAPEIVEIGAGGLLGYTEGPVTSASGVSASRFYTTWQRQAQGNWLVVFDNGYPVCA